VGSIDGQVGSVDGITASVGARCAGSAHGIDLLGAPRRFAESLKDSVERGRRWVSSPMGFIDRPMGFVDGRMGLLGGPTTFIDGAMARDDLSIDLIDAEIRARAVRNGRGWPDAACILR
jgi:hypothetical protein